MTDTPPIIGQTLTEEEAANALRISVRQFRRQRQSYKIRGVKSGGGVNGGRYIYAPEQIELLRKSMFGINNAPKR